MSSTFSSRERQWREAAGSIWLFDEIDRARHSGFGQTMHSARNLADGLQPFITGGIVHGHRLLRGCANVGERLLDS